MLKYKTRSGLNCVHDIPNEHVDIICFLQIYSEE